MRDKADPSPTPIGDANRWSEQASRWLRGRKLVLDGGPAPSEVPSTIVDLTGVPRIVREGAVPGEAVLCLT